MQLSWLLLILGSCFCVGVFFAAFLLWESLQLKLSLPSLAPLRFSLNLASFLSDRDFKLLLFTLAGEGGGGGDSESDQFQGVPETIFSFFTFCLKGLPWGMECFNLGRNCYRTQCYIFRGENIWGPYKEIWWSSLASSTMWRHREPIQKKQVPTKYQHFWLLDLDPSKI